jgi:hypothetical protein
VGTQFLWLFIWPANELTDKGVNVSDTINNEQINGKNYQVLHVSYDPAVGKELWNFYLDPNTNAMEGYRFYYQGKPDEGELIMLNEVLVVDGIKIPKVRKWYLNQGTVFLVPITSESRKADSSPHLVVIPTLL